MRAIVGTEGRPREDPVSGDAVTDAYGFCIGCCVNIGTAGVWPLISIPPAVTRGEVKFQI